MIEDSVRFALLGPLRARRGASELELGPAKQRAVLASLLLSANRPVSPSRIIDAVWGDEPPENGPNVVQKYVAGLRRVLEPERAPRSTGRLLALTDGGYRLAVGPGDTDLDLFAEHVRAAGRLRAGGRLAEAAGELRTALSLWTAEPLAGLGGTYFEAARARLADERAAAVEEWAEVELEQGHQHSLLPELSRLVAEFPLRERLCGVQMLALHHTGRQAEALAAYRALRTHLVATHGVDPSHPLQTLHQQILTNDPTLTPAPPRTNTPLHGSAFPPAPGSAAPDLSAPPHANTVHHAGGLPDASALPPAPANDALSVAAPAPVLASSPPGVVPGVPSASGSPFGVVPGPPVALGLPAALGGAPAPLSAARKERLGWRGWGLKVLAGVAPLVSVGLLGGLVMGGVAIRRRSIPLGMAAGGYLVATVVGFAMVDTSSEEITSTADGLGVLIVIASALASAVHLALIVPQRPRRTGGDDPRRQYGRQLAAEHPLIARQLGIGRPDLPNQFEDGGLIDINDAPEAVLRTLPGVSAERAALIVADRTHRGPFRTIEDLAARGLFPWPIPPEVAEVLLIIRIQDTVDGDRA